MITAAKAITDKIIVLDDCSTDDTRAVALAKGCRVFDVPEGWIYTHGFGALVAKQVSLCDTDYHLQIDTGEQLWIPPECPRIVGDYAWVLRLNLGWEGQKARQEMRNRLIKTSADLIFTALIHGAPRYEGVSNSALSRSQVLLFHTISPETSAYYRDRKNRLYFRLLRKGFVQKRLENRFWEAEYSSHRAAYDKNIRQLEAKIGVLHETQEEIKEVFS
jgi:glycosyltransferase involved in cell wall biosynthesis